jgi:nitrogenase molybdenum-iron protein alpha/beta subunit
MEAKEKAEELILKFMRLQEPNYNWFHSKLAKQCALIAVDEIVHSLSVIPYGMQYFSAIDYWIEVKQEIEKL